jgi:hypothetical protein
MDARHRESADAMRSRLSERTVSPAEFRGALAALSPADRDAWLDLVLGLAEIPTDDGSLPRGCVPYLPAPVDKLLEISVHADVQPSDVFVDVGSGAGRAIVAMHLMTGATAIGLEIQPKLVRVSRELAKQHGGGHVTVVEGDAALAIDHARTGSVFFLYCPFSGERLSKVLAGLEAVARNRQIRVCSLDLPRLEYPWLDLSSHPSADVEIYRSRTS